MMLFTKDIDKKLFQQFPLGNDLDAQQVVCKIFNPYGRGTWYILNSDPNDPDYLWAIVDLFEIEVGSVSREDLESIKVPPFRLPLERDKGFSPMNAGDLYRNLMSGKRYAQGGVSDVQVLHVEQGGKPQAYLAPDPVKPDSKLVMLAKGGATE